MTLPDLKPPRKPPSKVWLYGPYIVLIVAAVIWSGAWIWIRGRVVADLDAARTAAPGRPALAWNHQSVGGYPFRIEVILDGVKAAQPSGWAVSAPQIRAESYAYDLKHWIGYAPQGVVVSRPGGDGDLAITGQALRASVVQEQSGQARIAIEGLNLSFTPKPGAASFPLQSAQYLNIHTRPAGQDGVEFAVQVQVTKLSPGEAMGALVRDQPFDMAWRGTLANSSALRGVDWPTAVRAWATAGGGLQVADGFIHAGPIRLDGATGRLLIAPGGKPTGVLHFSQVQAPFSDSDLTFQNGAMRLGRFDLGSGPRVY
jgi:hypothetical protein